MTTHPLGAKPLLFHYWRSSASWRVRWALAIKDIAYDSVAVNIASGEQHDAEYRRRNPMGHVPALVVGERVLTESVAILEWLDETVPSPRLYPEDPWQRFRTRQIIETVNAGMQPLQNLVVLARVGDGDAQRAWAAHFNDRGLRALENLLVQSAAEFPGDHCVGTSLTAADLFLVPQVFAARRFGVDLAPFPRVVACEVAALRTGHADGARPERQPGAPAV